MKNITHISPNDCCGCEACANICPLQCIQMGMDYFGFFHPVVKEDKCIGCGRCLHACPVNLKPKEANIKSIYAAFSKDNDVRLESSSGGVFSLLADYVLQSGGCVYGASFTDARNVEHVRVVTKEDLSQIRKSKYIQSRINNIFKDVENDLKSSRIVLFSGTPCQIAGLKRFLRKEYESLICVEIVCHGVPSRMAYDSYLDEIEKQYNTKILSIDFRDKSSGWSRYSVTLRLENYKVISQESKENNYMQGFIKNLYNRSSCSTCRYKLRSSQADLTLGDFWGIKGIFNEGFDDEDFGVSFVAVMTIKGVKKLEAIKDKIKELRSVDLEEAIRYNPSIVRSFKARQGRLKFFNDLHEGKEFSFSFNDNIEKGESRRKLIKSLLKNCFSRVRVHVRINRLK